MERMPIRQRGNRETDGADAIRDFKPQRIGIVLDAVDIRPQAKREIYGKVRGNPIRHWTRHLTVVRKIDTSPHV